MNARLVSIGALLVPLALGALGALVLAGCASTSGTPRQQIHEWASGAGYSSDNSYIVSDLKALMTATSRGARRHAGQMTLIHTVCIGFGADAQTLWGNLPTPDQKLTNELNDALENDFEQAAVDCNEASSFSSADYARFLALLQRGRAQYAIATKRLASFGVR